MATIQYSVRIGKTYDKFFYKSYIITHRGSLVIYVASSETRIFDFSH